jgi:hypothetical protein
MKKGDGSAAERWRIVFERHAGSAAFTERALAPIVSVRCCHPRTYETCIRIRDSVHVHTAARQLLTGVGGSLEVSIAWVDEETGILCKARIDFTTTRLPACADRRREVHHGCERDAFMRSIWEYGYHRQGAHYLEGDR